MCRVLHKICTEILEREESTNDTGGGCPVFVV